MPASTRTKIGLEVMGNLERAVRVSIRATVASRGMMFKSSLSPVQRLRTGMNAHGVRFKRLADDSDISICNDKIWRTLANGRKCQGIPSHGGNTGSNPVGDANYFNVL
jgi:hypothetical protein